MNNKKINLKIKKEKKILSISQIAILVIATIAFSWMVGGEVRLVKADVMTCQDTYNGNCRATCLSNEVDSGYACDGSQKCCIPTTLPVCGTLGAYGTCMSLNNCETVNYNARCLISGEICCALPKTTSSNEEEEKNKLSLTDITGGAMSLYGGYKTTYPLLQKGVSNLIGGGEKKAIADAAIKKTYSGTMEEYMGGTSETTKTGLGEYTKLFGTSNTAIGQIVSNAVWAAATYFLISYLAKQFASDRNLGDIQTALQIGAGVGMVGVTVWAAVMAGESTGGPPGWIAAAVTAVAFGVYMLVGYKVYSKETFTFRVTMWQPPVGGSECNKCNSLRIAGQNACSEYICHSYGASCSWVNDETQYETCIDVNPNDRTPPIITPVKEIYGENVFKNNEEYNYQISSAGAKIVYIGEGGETGGCVPAFSSIKLAIKTNENAQCRISLEAKERNVNEEQFNLMSDMAEGSSYTENHTLTLPSIVTASEEALTVAGYQLNNGGNYKFYIRCKDAKGNINTIDYIMSFCVQQGPDMNPPEIIGTTPATESFIAHGIETINDFQVYTNEPADCKWDVQPKAYNDMNYNFDTCSQTIDQRIIGFDLGCQGTLTGIKEGVNKFYIRCKDQPELKETINENKRNTGSIQEIILMGTKELVIREVTINGEENNTLIKDSIENADVKIEVMTFGGAEEGEARCKYSYDLKEPRTYSQFDNSGNKEYSNTNVNNLYLTGGNYKQTIQCFDVAGNIAETMINFSVAVDKTSPNIVRVYKDDNYLKIVTDEEAECFYTDFGCIYDLDEDGIPLISSNLLNHITDWNIEHDFYVKCRDKHGNRPNEESCSLIVRPFDILSAQEA